MGETRHRARSLADLRQAASVDPRQSRVFHRQNLHRKMHTKDSNKA